MAEESLENLMKKLFEREIRWKDKRLLRKKLKEGYSYGSRMEEYPCPQCKKPLGYT